MCFFRVEAFWKAFEHMVRDRKATPEHILSWDHLRKSLKDTQGLNFWKLEAFCTLRPKRCTRSLGDLYNYCISIIVINHLRVNGMILQGRVKPKRPRNARGDVARFLNAMLQTAAQRSLCAPSHIPTCALVAVDVFFFCKV